MPKTPQDIRSNDAIAAEALKASKEIKRFSPANSALENEKKKNMIGMSQSADNEDVLHQDRKGLQTAKPGSVNQFPQPIEESDHVEPVGTLKTNSMDG